jgi:biopolymer transport protein ExbD
MVKSTPSDETAVMAEINVTPFTDVLLVLLIIFVVLASLVTPAGFQREIPKPCACSTLVRPEHSALVTIDAHGRIAIDGTATDERSIYGLLAARVARDRALNLDIDANPRAAFGLMIRVLDAAKTAGVRDVSFVSQ